MYHNQTQIGVFIQWFKHVHVISGNYPLLGGHLIVYMYQIKWSACESLTFFFKLKTVFNQLKINIIQHLASLNISQTPLMHVYMSLYYLYMYAVVL